MSFKAYIIEKIQELIRVYYQLHSNGPNYLKILQIGWTIFDLNPDNIYDIITGHLKLTLLIVSSRKATNLKHP